MNYLSVCSGIEAATVAWEPLGFRAIGFSEIEKFPSAVLAHHYPSVPNWGDMTNHRNWDLGRTDINVLVGGTPCQSFSVAGLRKGLDDPRGNLALEFLSIADRLRPRWIVWENVPGVLSSSGGRDFGSFLGGLGQLGYRWAYRVLDAQFFGVPQRRRRVFVVGHLGDWARAAAVLFDQESLSGNPAPSRSPGQNTAATAGPGSPGRWPPDVAPTLDANYGKNQGQDRDHIEKHSAGLFVPQAYGGNNTSGPIDVATACLAHPTVRGDFESETFVLHGQENALAFQPRYARNGRGAPDTIAAPLTAEAGRTGKGDSAQCVAFDTTQITSKTNRSNPQPGDPVHPLAAGAHPPAIAGGMQVRRLTPMECERLQGFPDDYTQIPYRGKPADRCPDGPRYKALGNSMAVPVMRWIGERIQMVDSI